MRDGHAVFIVHLGDDGGGAAHRLVAEVHRAAGLQTADAVVVDDLQNFGLVEAFHGLGGLVVVHQNDATFLQIDDVPAADHAAVFAVLVQDGEIAVAHLGHHTGNIGHRRDEGELHDVVAGHIIGDGCTLADELAHGIGILGRGHDGHTGLLGDALDGAAHLGAVADDEQRGFLFNGAQLALVAVGEDDDVAFLHRALQHFRRGRADADAAGGAHCVLAAHHHGAVQRFKDVLIAGLALGENFGIEHVHVGRGDILHSDDAFQFVVRAGDGQGVDLLIAHDLPRFAQAGGTRDAGHLAVIHITNFGVHVRAHARRFDAELFQHELGLLVHFAGAAGLADQITGLVFQLCIGDGGADGVGVRVAVADDHDFVGCFGHILPPLGPYLPYISYLISLRRAASCTKPPAVALL